VAIDGDQELKKWGLFFTDGGKSEVDVFESIACYFLLFLFELFVDVFDIVV
jgi:hypothetical protein